MGKPFTIQKEDDIKIEILKKQFGFKTKIEVVRSALNLLEAGSQNRRNLRPRSFEGVFKS
jgi:hypothetical protein